MSNELDTENRNNETASNYPTQSKVKKMHNIIINNLELSKTAE